MPDLDFNVKHLPKDLNSRKHVPVKGTQGSNIKCGNASSSFRFLFKDAVKNREYCGFGLARPCGSYQKSMLAVHYVRKCPFLRLCGFCKPQCIQCALNFRVESIEYIIECHFSKAHFDAAVADAALKPQQENSESWHSEKHVQP
ncbi:hypothetical protein SDC9_119451 [bioreactor metagenome]|uniref:Uncharacterized protein n=1 Tax=bioreactor metagenome TaxID=1076179 RepID=A0A645C4J5_9ZZZZ